MKKYEIAKLATKYLRHIFGNTNVPDAIGCICSKWNKNIYTCGSWSYIVNKDIIIEQNELRDKIFYTGEALNNEYRGMVHGAYLIGQRYVDNYLYLIKRYRSKN